MDVEKLNLSAIRTVRVLRPLKAINRIPSMRLEKGFKVCKIFAAPCLQDPGDAAAGHPAHAGQCAAALLLRLLHLWDCGGAAVGRTPQTRMLCQVRSMIIVDSAYFDIEQQF